MKQIAYWLVIMGATIWITLHPMVIFAATRCPYMRHDGFAAFQSTVSYSVTFAGIFGTLALIAAITEYFYDLETGYDED